MKQNALFWFDSAENHFSCAERNFEAGDYLQTSIACHHAMENLIKAIYYERNNREAPYKHNLVSLVQDTLGEAWQSLLNPEQVSFYSKLSAVYPAMKYPDYRNLSNERVSKKLAEYYILNMRGEFEWWKEFLK